jgi:protein phosphatase
MGTTLDVVLIAGAEAFVAHVGDSRTYLVREGRSSQITTDHTVAEVLVIEGKLTIEEAAVSPLRTILVNAIGVSADVGVEISHVRLRQGDRMLLCSDGLHDYFPADEEIADHLVEGDIQEALQGMVDLAKQRGGHDNITGIVVDVVECSEEEEDQDAEPPSISDGIPRTMGHAETAPVDVIDDEAPADTKARPRKSRAKKPRGKKKPEDPTRSTLPMGVDAVAEDAASKPTKQMQAEPAPEGTRKTEPMPTVAPPDDD